MRGTMALMGMMLMSTMTTTAAGANPPHAKLRAVPLTQVTIQDGFWQPRLEINRTSTLPHNLKMCEDTGRIANFARAGGHVEGKYEGRYYNDSDVYKVLEGAAYILAAHPDEAVEARIDAIIDKIAAAQQPDGYINAYYTLMEPDKRWTNLRDMHELYCAGHMFEAAVEYKRATGKATLLDVARKMADHIDAIFGPEKRLGYPGHEEIELALIKLYRETGEERYKQLAQFFIDTRSNPPIHDALYLQAHKPVREQEEIVGHAVRAMYLYSGVADVASLSGDKAYLDALERIWQDVAYRKLYITGGVGARHHGEAFGGAYELPNDSAYAETCAGIGLVFWNHRLLLLHGEARFGDVLERALYNAVPSSVSLKGDTFFYVNPLRSGGNHHREPWFGTACCPTNVVRVLPQVARYAYAQSDNSVWVNLYVGSTAEAELAGGRVKLVQETKYPWDGDVRISVEPAKMMTFGVHLRIPGWCEGAAVTVNGERAATDSLAGRYLELKRAWKPGDVIELSMPMALKRMRAHPQVAADRGYVALQRGPIVFCLEAVDNGGKAFNLVLPPDATIEAHFDPDLLGGVMVVKGEGVAVEPLDWANKLYQPAGAKTREVELTAVPYCVWDNRDPGEMTVWIPEAPSGAE
jgi:hypothetical protein